MRRVVRRVTKLHAGAAGKKGPADTEAKNHAKKEAKKVVCPFVNQYLRFPPVQNEDRTAMGIPNRDTTPTDVPVPSAQSEVDLPFPVFTRCKKERFDFDGESGNTVYFCLRYENSKGNVSFWKGYKLFKGDIVFFEGYSSNDKKLYIINTLALKSNLRFGEVCCSHVVVALRGLIPF